MMCPASGRNHVPGDRRVARRADAVCLFGRCTAVGHGRIADGRTLRTVPTPGEPTGLRLPDGQRVTLPLRPRRFGAGDRLEVRRILASFPAGHTARLRRFRPTASGCTCAIRFDHDISGSTGARQGTRTGGGRAGTDRGRDLGRRQPALVANFFRRVRRPVRGDGGRVLRDRGRHPHIRNRAGPAHHGHDEREGYRSDSDGKYALLVHILARYHLPTERVDGSWMNGNALTVIDVRRARGAQHGSVRGYFEGAAIREVACTADGRWICATTPERTN